MDDIFGAEDGRVLVRMGDLSITKSDFGTLKPGKWLNDSVSLLLKKYFVRGMFCD